MLKRINISKLVTLAFSSLVATGAVWTATASLAVAECVEVTSGTNYEPSSANVQITTTRDRKPLPNVNIYLDTPRAEKRFLRTNAEGIIFFSKLSPGKHCISATALDKAAAQVCIEVSSDSTIESSSFSIELPPSVTAEELAVAEGLPVTDRTQGFTGIVWDETGAVVPGSNIEILTKGSNNKDLAIQVEANASGHFSALLPDGVYVAFFRSSGFRTRTEVFEIGKKFQPKDLRISLKIGGC